MTSGRMLEIFDHPKPVIAQVHGYCLAGGCDLMMMCDVAIASEDAIFGEPEIRFGSGVVTMVMPWLIGARKAKELLLTGEDRISAQEAPGSAWSTAWCRPSGWRRRPWPSPNASRSSTPSRSR